MRDGQTDGRTDGVKPVYPPQQLRCAEGIIMVGPIKLLYITMFIIGKSCKKLIFGPVKHEKFSWCLYDGPKVQQSLLVLRNFYCQNIRILFKTFLQFNSILIVFELLANDISWCSIYFMISWLDLLGHCMYFFAPPKLQSWTFKGNLIGGPNVHQMTEYYF